MKSASRPSANAVSASRLAGPPISSAKAAFSRSRAARIAGAQRLGHRPLDRDQRRDRPRRPAPRRAGAPRAAGRRARRPARPAPSRAPARRRPTRPTAASTRRSGARRSRGKRYDDAASGATPRLVNGHLSRAVLDMNARSAKPRIVAPMPSPIPLTAHTSGLGKAIERVEQPEEAVRARHEVRVGRPPVHLEQVGAGAERPPVPGEQHDGDRGVVGGGEQRLGGGVVERLVEGVEGLGAVEGERAHPLASSSIWSVIAQGRTSR